MVTAFATVLLVVTASPVLLIWLLPVTGSAWASAELSDEVEGSTCRGTVETAVAGSAERPRYFCKMLSDTCAGTDAAVEGPDVKTG